MPDHLGQLSTLLSSATDSAVSAAETQAMAYAQSLYDQYETQIWISGFVLAFWIIWVSTRDTCEAGSKGRKGKRK
jgi:hypothetical protein